MPVVEVPAQLTVEHLLTAAKQLSKTELGELTAELVKWQVRNGLGLARQKELVREARIALPPAQHKRLQTLIAKSENGELSAQELSDYRALARRVERLNLRRIRALSKLAALLGKPAEIVMHEIGLESIGYEG